MGAVIMGSDLLGKPFKCYDNHAPFIYNYTKKKYAIIRVFHYNPFTHAPLHKKFVPASLNGTA